MIRNQWYVVLESGDVPRGRPVGVTRMGERLVFWRDSTGTVACHRDLCPHRGAAFSAGKVRGDRLLCPFHGFEYDSSGICRLIPADGRAFASPEVFRADTYPTAEAHGFIYLFWGEPQMLRPGVALPPVPFFDNIPDDWVYGRLRAHWPTHYSRAVENQLDAVHVPFVHHNTIGRGNRTVVDGPLIQWQRPDLMYVYVFNRADDGTPPRKARQLAVPNVPFHLEFLFPNLWQNHIGEDIRILVAFVPVDDADALIYLHYFQRFVRFPGLAQAVTWLSMPFNSLVLRQDQRVVSTQRPLRTSLRMGEKLIQGDGPIIAYRRRRAQLLGEEPPTGESKGGNRQPNDA